MSDPPIDYGPYDDGFEDDQKRLDAWRKAKADLAREERKRKGNGKRHPNSHQVAPEVAGDKAVIDAIQGKLHLVVREAEQALLTAAVPIFQRIGVLVRPAILPVEVQIAGTTVSAGTLVIEPVNKAWLAEKMNEVAVWRKWNERQGRFVVTDCPTKYAEHYLAKKGEWNVRVLTGIVEAPTLRRDGSLLTTPGYDPVSGLYLNYTGLPVTVPDHPTREEALTALDVLKEPFEEFPFVTEVDRSVALSGVLTAVNRRPLKTAPYHAFDAPVPGAGKGLLVDTCALVATGRVATVSTLGDNETETEKRLSALLMKGVPIINLDNAARPVEGDFICSLATQETVDPRILGQSATATIPTNTAAVFLTGNNLVFKGDMTRRVLLCRIDPRCERPDALQFKRNLHEFVPANRHRLLSAALTVLRAFVSAGRPAHSLAPYGSFEEWDRLIRGALLWLGLPDPLESRERITSSDPAQQQLSALLSAWYAVFREQGVTTADVTKAARVTVTAGEETYSIPGGEALRQTLLAVAGKGEVISSHNLGRYLSKNKDRIMEGHRLEQVGSHGHTLVWRVVCGVHGVHGVRSILSREFRSEEDIAKNIYRSETDSTNSTNSTNSTHPQAQGCHACVHFRSRSYTCPHVLTGIADPSTPPCGWQHFESKGK